MQKDIQINVYGEGSYEKLNEIMTHIDDKVDVDFMLDVNYDNIRKRLNIDIDNNLIDNILEESLNITVLNIR